MVEWRDSAQPTSAWQWVTDYEIPEAVGCVSVGFLIAQTKDTIAVAANLGDMGQESCQASGVIRIPRCAVTKLRKVRL